MSVTSLTSDAQTFFQVYSALRFPIIASDLRRLIWGLRTYPHGPSNLHVPLSLAPTDRRIGLSAALGGLFSAIEPDVDVVTALRTELQQRDSDLVDSFDAMVAQRHSVWVGEVNDQIAWEEASLWPLACSGVFQQLSNLLVLHRQAIHNRIAQVPGVVILSEYPRHLPTELHYALASLGAWIGGAANVQFFGLHATSAPLRDPALNRSQAQQIGYSGEEAGALVASGIVTLPDTVIAPLLSAQQHDAMVLIGSIPADEMNMANPPVPQLPTPRLPGYVLDTHYRAAFNARTLVARGLYGAQNVLRDHYTAFYQGLQVASLVRCKHYCAPVVDVASRDEVENLVASVPRHGSDGLYFRGQGRLYLLERDVHVRKFLFADSCDAEPSLPTAASRSPGFDYDTLHFALRRFLGDRLDAVAPLPNGGSAPASTPWQEACESPACDLDFALMALAQHYGIPTHGLDVTTEIDVALWFALNRFERGTDGRARYHQRRETEWGTTRENWPVLLVCQQVTHSVGASLHECYELEAFGLTAARPRAQAARFFLGGHSDHRNRLAETLVCVLRLAPGDYAVRSTFDALFPPPEEDLAYRWMLEFAEHPAYRTLGADAVNRFQGIQ